jgi:citrate synthase
MWRWVAVIAGKIRRVVPTYGHTVQNNQDSRFGTQKYWLGRLGRS